MRVREIMTSNPATARADTKLDEIARLMIAQDCGCIPVVDDERSGHIMGVVTDRDITTRAVARGRNPIDLAAGDVMTRNVASVRQDEDLDAVRRTMEDRQVRRVPVVDENGRCCGIVSQADIARRAPEEVTAEIVHELSMPDEKGRSV